MLIPLLLFLSPVLALPISNPEPSEPVCTHRFPVVSEIPHPVTLEPRSRVVKRNAEHQLRIKVFYDRSVEGLSRRRRNTIKDKVRKLKACDTAYVVYVLYLNFGFTIILRFALNFSGMDKMYFNKDDQ